MVVTAPGIHNPSLNAAIPPEWGDAVNDDLTSLDTRISARPNTCRVGRSASWSLANATVATVPWDMEFYDNNAMHDNVTNNSRITVKTAGMYMVGVQITWTGSATAGTRWLCILRKNAIEIARQEYIAAGGNPAHAFSTIDEAVVNDYFDVQAYQSSGVANDTFHFGSPARLPNFYAHYLSP